MDSDGSDGNLPLSSVRPSKRSRSENLDSEISDPSPKKAKAGNGTVMKKSTKVCPVQGTHSSEDATSDDEPLIKRGKQDRKVAEAADSNSDDEPLAKASKRTVEAEEEADSDSDDEALIKLAKKAKEKGGRGDENRLSAAEKEVKPESTCDATSSGSEEKEDEEAGEEDEDQGKQEKDMQKMKEKVAKMLESSSSDSSASENNQDEQNDEPKLARNGDRKPVSKAGQQSKKSRKKDLPRKRPQESDSDGESTHVPSENGAPEKPKTKWKKKENEHRAPKKKQIKSAEKISSEDKVDGSDADSDASEGPSKKEKKKEGEGDTSDTSISESGDNKKSEHQAEKKKKRTFKQKEESSDPASNQLKKIKHLVVLCGLRFNYKKMFADVSSDEQRVKLIKKALHDKGVKHLSEEGCKRYRLQREQEQELAELSRNRIIEPESTLRVTRSSRKGAMKEQKKGRVARLSTSSSEADSETEKIREENIQIFSRLKGIVSDESD